MRQSAKTRASLSRKRQALSRELDVWLQRERDMEAAKHLNEKSFNHLFVWQDQTVLREIPDIPKKLEFIRQEQARLREALHRLDRGVRRQRAWATGKFCY